MFLDDDVRYFMRFRFMSFHGCLDRNVLLVGEGTPCARVLKASSGTPASPSGVKICIILRVLIGRYCRLYVQAALMCYLGLLAVLFSPWES